MSTKIKNSKVPYPNLYLNFNTIEIKIPGHWLVVEGILEAGLEVSFMKLNISVTQNSRSFAIPRTDQHAFEVVG